jgi:hypothetical protein
VLLLLLLLLLLLALSWRPLGADGGSAAAIL